MPDLFGRILHRSGIVTYAAGEDSSTRVLPRFEHALHLAGPLRGLAVADVGCWTGDFLHLCQGVGATSLVGFDIGGPWLVDARRRLPNATLVEVADLSELQAANISQVDVVFVLETLEHIPRGREFEAMRALSRILKPGGCLILSTPAAGIAACADPAWVLAGHRHYRARTIRRLAQSGGFESTTFRYSGDLRESLDVALLYLYKHVLRQPYRSPHLLAGAGHRLTMQRRFDSTTIWVRATKQRNPSGFPPP